MSSILKLGVYMGDRRVGTLAEDPNRTIFFEYAPEWLLDGHSLSPFELPLTPGLKTPRSLMFEGLFGVFDDSLPDGWGRLLMDRFFRSQGVVPAALSPLDRLAYVGVNGMGALEYRPANHGAHEEVHGLDLAAVAAQAERIAAGSEEEVLPALREAAGSSGGSRPKAFVALNPASGLLASDSLALDPVYEHWIVKFRAKEDPRDAGAIEQAYAEMAKAAGIQMHPTRLFRTADGVFFGTRRFDRGSAGTRIHTHTLGGMVNSDFRHPSLDYQDFLETVLAVTRDIRQVKEAFRRAAFNVMAHNRDDHVKNHAFVLTPNGDWQLAPCYDVIHSHGIRGQHNMTVAGKGIPTVKDLKVLGAEVGLPAKEVDAIIEAVASAVRRWPAFASADGVSSSSQNIISRDFLTG